MKVENLMVGDWVDVYHELPDESGFYKPLRVVGIHYNDGICFGDSTIESPWNNLEEFEDGVKPIPLTPEILKKNDILYRKPSFYYIINDDKDLECTHYIYQTVQEDWAIGVDTGAYDGSVFARIKYVHELQHALKLCGIDKEIVV